MLSSALWMLDNGNATNGTLCRRLFTDQLTPIRVRVWDAAIFLPNLVFAAFLVSKVARIRAKLAGTGSPVYLAFYVLVFVSVAAALLRSICVIIVGSLDWPDGQILIKILWLCIQFVLTSLEIVVLLFGFFFGHLDSRTSIRRALTATAVVSGVISTLQASLEFNAENVGFETKSADSVFLLVSASVFAAAYLLAALSPLMPAYRCLLLPKRKSFYVYCAFLFVVYLFQLIAGCLLLAANVAGLCVLSIPLYIYYTCYVPVVYLVFLRGFVSRERMELMFSYSNQKQYFGRGGDAESATTLPSAAESDVGSPIFAEPSEQLQSTSKA